MQPSPNATVVLGWAAFENFRSPCFSLGAAVLDSEFRADPGSGLRIEQSPAGHIESSVRKISIYQYIENVYLKCMVRITGNLQPASQPAAGDDGKRVWWR